MIPMTWEQVEDMPWGQAAAFVASKSDLEDAGLEFEIVYDNGLELDIAGFRIGPQDVAILGRGAAKTGAFSLIVSAESELMPGDLMNALGIPYELSDWQPI